MDFHKPHSVGPPESRITKAVTAQLRQNFEPSLNHLQECTETLLARIKNLDDDEYQIGCQQILQAIEQLRQRIHEPETNPGDPIQTERQLRHDLSNLIGGIKGAGEWLNEEFEDRGMDALGTLARELVEETERLQGKLDQVIRYVMEPLRDLPSAQLATAVIDSITPTDLDKPSTGLSNPQQFTLLVVDDNSLNQIALRHRLEREGYRVETADTGKAALERLEAITSDRQTSIDLILLDLLMPDLNGYQVLQRLKAERRWQDIPVIMVSGWDDLPIIVRCIENGAEDYLLKPIEPTLLRARVGSALEKHWLHQREQELLQREIDQAIEIQRSLLPPPAPLGSVIDGRNRPIRYVSGDFFAHFQRPDGIVPFALGDVSGKGFDAALLMAKVSGLFRYLSQSREDSSALLVTLNQEFHDKSMPGRFLTAVVGFYNPANADITFANAGHVPPVVISTDGKATCFPAKAPPLGVLRQTRFTNQRVILEPGDAFYVFSDGFIECLQPDGQELGINGFITLLKRVRGLPVKQQLDWLFAEITGPGWQSQDDLTMLAIVPSEQAGHHGGRE